MSSAGDVYASPLFIPSRSRIRRDRFSRLTEFAISRRHLPLQSAAICSQSARDWLLRFPHPRLLPYQSVSFQLELISPGCPCSTTTTGDAITAIPATPMQDGFPHPMGITLSLEIEVFWSMLLVIYN
jgi:hypothetical protein